MLIGEDKKVKIKANGYEYTGKVKELKKSNPKRVSVTLETETGTRHIWVDEIQSIERLDRKIKDK